MLSPRAFLAEVHRIRRKVRPKTARAFVGPDDMKVVRIAPGALSVDLKIRAELEKAKKQIPFIKRGKRGTGTELRDLGPTYLPIPRGD